MDLAGTNYQFCEPMSIQEILFLGVHKQFAKTSFQNLPTLPMKLYVPVSQFCIYKSVYIKVFLLNCVYIYMLMLTSLYNYVEVCFSNIVSRNS